MRRTRREKGRKIGISKKLYISIATAFLTSTLVVLLTIFLFTGAYLLKQEQAEANELTAQVSTQLQDILREAEKLCDIIGRNYDMQEMLRSPSPAPGDLTGSARERTDINGKIAQLTQSFTDNVDNIGIFLRDGRSFKYSAFSNRRTDFRGEDWYAQLLESEDLRWIGIHDTSLGLHSLEWRCLVGGTRLTNMRNNEVAGVILVEIGLPTIARALDAWSARDICIELLDAADGAVLYRAGEADRLWTGVRSEAQLAELFSVRISISRATMLDSFTRMLLGFAVLAVAASLVMMRFSTNGLRQSIAQPIKQLLGCVNAFEDDRKDVAIDIDTDIAEISCLIDGVEDLFGRIRRLLDAREEEQKIIRRAQVAALQEQINPHFLYNTMDSISWLIRTGERDKALGTLHSFAALFRLSLNNGRNYVTIEEELTYIRHYIDILNVRYNNQIRYAIEVLDEALLDSFIPKLVLQPLVENSIEHGIGMRDSQSGSIRIRLLRGASGPRIEVWDDGVGIAPEALKEINTLLAGAESPGDGERRSYGIYNVNKRFRVAYGREYGITYESVYGMRTLVRIEAPRCNMKGEIIGD